MLYLKISANNYVLWEGQEIAGIKHPLQIEELWSVQDLENINLYFPAQADPVPNNYVVTSKDVKEIDGIVKFVNTISPAPYPTKEDVILERERRLSLGFYYDFNDDRGIHKIGTTPEDITGWDEVTQIAQAFISIGMPTSTITIITDTAPAIITAMEWQTILLAAASFRQPIWQKSFILQTMTPIPYDFRDDSFWS